MVQYSFFIAVVLFLCCSVSSQDFLPDYEDDNPLPPRHERIRRFVRFMSRKPGLDAKPEKGIGFKGHVRNLLKGGTLGMEFYIPHVNLFGKYFPYWKEMLGNEGKKDVGKDTKDEEDKFDDEEADDEDDVELADEEADDEDDVELADEGDHEIGSDKREENELDYVHVIDPRIKNHEP